MAESTVYRNALPQQTMLQEYRIESVLGAGGFGMTYLARDTHLDKSVAIKEYLPADLALRALDGSIVPINTESEHDYRWGLDRFILEARTLAKFSHPNIVRVNRYFEANGTGYMVMDYEEGESLNQMLRHTPRPNEKALKALVVPLLDGLQAVHEIGFLHRDIKPSNIFLRESGSPVLLDFGSARQTGSGTRSLTSVLTPGYAPLEQYSSDGHQGPWSDIYAMGGVLYRAIVNDNPPDAVSRFRNDAAQQAIDAARDRYSESFLQAIKWALTLDEKARPQSVSEWKSRLLGEITAPAAVPMAVRPVADVTTLPLASRQEPAYEKTARVTATRPRPAPPRAEEKSKWRWVGIAAVLLIAVAAAGAWKKQYDAKERAMQEAIQLETRRAEAASRAAEQQAQERHAVEQRAAELDAARRQAEEELRLASAAKAGPQTQEASSARERPGRERESRPGDSPELDREKRMAEREFRQADHNGDGYLDRDEAKRFPFVAREFNRVDVDGDGRISPQEFWRLRHLQAMRKGQPLQ